MPTMTDPAASAWMTGCLAFDSAFKRQYRHQNNIMTTKEKMHFCQEEIGNIPNGTDGQTVGMETLAGASQALLTHLRGEGGKEIAS